METKQKNPDAAKKRVNPAKPRQPVTEEQRRAAAARRAAAQKAAAQSAPGEQQPKKRPAQSRQEAPQQRRSRETARQAQEPRRTPPQGTGPRKSAPQRTGQQPAPKRSPQQAAAQRRAAQQKGKNPIQKLLSGGKTQKKDPQKEMDRAEQAIARQEQRKAQAERRRKQAQRYDTPAVIYTQPAPFNRNRLFVQLMTVTAVVIAFVMGLSVFFKVETVTVSGAETYSAWSVREASGIKEGDNLLTFSKARASAKIRAELSYVDKVRIGIKLPDTVNIYIEELDVAYAIKDSTGTWWLMTSDGRMVQQIDTATASNYTQVLGVAVDKPQVNEAAVALEDIPTETSEDGELIPITVTGAQRLYSALQILKALEANDIVGEAASVDVTRLEEVMLWYGTRFQVNLGDTSDMEYKIACMNTAILQMSDYQAGILDISFNHWEDQVGFTPFS